MHGYAINAANNAVSISLIHWTANSFYL